MNHSSFTNEYYQRDGVEIGDYTYGVPLITRNTDKYKLKIGKFCAISDNVHILLDANHRTNWVTNYPLSLGILREAPSNYEHPAGKGDMVIGNDVWIGLNVIILPGVNIGNGAVIAAGAVVAKDVADYEIVGGVPAKHINFRFTSDQIDKLLKISWWDWDINKIKDNIGLLESENINNFIEKHLN